MDNLQKLYKVLPNTTAYISKSLADKILSNEYQAQAIDFLLSTGSTLDIEPMGKELSNWNESITVNKYRCCLKNKKGVLTFDFYDSIKNTQENKSARLDFYTVLCCINYFDVYENFDDFLLQNYSIITSENDYIKYKSTYLEIERQIKALRKMYTPDEISKLKEIV